MRKYVIKDKFEKWDETLRGIWYKKIGKNQHLIWYSHPEARVDNNLLYYALIDGVREILNEPIQRKSP